MRDDAFGTPFKFSTVALLFHLLQTWRQVRQDEASQGGPLQGQHNTCMHVWRPMQLPANATCTYYDMQEPCVCVAQAAAAEGEVHEKAKTVQQLLHEVEEKKVCIWSTAFRLSANPSSNLIQGGHLAQ